MKNTTLRILAAAYFLAAVTFLLIGGERLLKSWHYEDRGLKQSVRLSLEELEPVSVLPYQSEETEGESWFVSTDADPQLYWKQDAYIETVRFTMHRASFGSGTLLYWKEPGQKDFSEIQSVYGKEISPDCYEYDLGGVRVSEIRIDPDSVGGVLTRFDDLQINPQRSWIWAFKPSWKGLLLFLTLPLFAAAIILEAKSIFKK